MKVLKRYFVHELNRLLRLRVLFVVLLLIFFCIGLLQYGIVRYESSLDKKEKFSDLERQRVAQYITYTQYGLYGYRIMFLPHLNAIYFNDSGVLSEMRSFVDSGERLKIYYPLKGKNLFRVRISGMTDYSGFLLYFGSLLTLFYGFEAFLSREYLKFLASLSSVKHLYILIFISRLFIVLLLLLFLFMCSYLLTVLNGLTVSLNFFLVKLLPGIFPVFAFFLALGMVFGTMKKRTAGIAAVLGCWFLLLFMLPAAMDFFISHKANMITPLNKHEMDKLKVVMDFEKRAIEEAGRFSYGESVNDKRRQVILSYYNNEFKRLNRMEKELREEMSSNVRLYYGLSMIFPTTYFRSMADELSSKGYLNMLDYYSITQELKKKFFKFFMDKLYFSGEGNFSRVENFVKGEENIYYAQSRLPRFYVWGLLLTLMYIIFLYYLGNRRFRKSLDIVPVLKFERNVNKTMRLESKSEFLKVYYIYDRRLSGLLYCAFKGIYKKDEANDFEIEIKTNGSPLIRGQGVSSMVYIVNQEDVPSDVRAKDLLAVITGLLKYSREEEESLRFEFIKPEEMKRRLETLNGIQTGELLTAALAHLKKALYIVDDLSRGMPLEFIIILNERMEKLADTGAAVVYLTTEDIVQLDQSLDNPLLVCPSHHWSDIVRSMQKNREVDN
jgi:hypothetical protein